MSDIDVAIIGAGVVGLAIGASAARRGRDVIVIESANAIGTETSSRNSEVIHAGLYYPPNSLKTKLCIEGNHRLYEWCADRNVQVRKTGKLVIACSFDEVIKLEKLKEKANSLEIESENGFGIESDLICHSSLFLPSSGMVNVHELMLSLVFEIERYGGTIVFNTPVLSGNIDTLEIITGGNDPGRFTCNNIVNCAGHGSTNLSFGIKDLPEIYLAKGSYFMLEGKAPFQRLIYPLPSSSSAGLHYSLDWSGRARFGPDIEWVSEIDYNVDPNRINHFIPEIQKFWPKLPIDKLQPDFAGIRPKLSGPGESTKDFMIRKYGSYIALYGIDSPGLTASLALGEYLVKIM